MRVSTRRVLSSVAALGVALVGVTLPSPPPAAAVPAPWHWVRVEDPVTVAPHGYYSIREFCPSGYTVISGGLKLPIGSGVYRNAEYRQTDESGSGWFVSFENPSGTSGTASVVAECVLTSDLPAISHHLVEFPTNSYGEAKGTVSCLNPGEVALAGGVDWSNVNSRRIYRSGPTSDGTGWVAEGSNSVSGAVFAVEVYCVAPADVPGYQLIADQYTASGNGSHASTCPVGKRILSGGTEGVGAENASYPSLNKWTVTTYSLISYTTSVRAICVDAGLPTVAISQASPSDGAVTSNRFASFQMTGSDPAGFPNSFKCSLDGAVATTCGGSVGYGPLTDGVHHFVVTNQTADLRSSNVASVSWTVDGTAPSLTAPTLDPVTLRQGLPVTWTGSDQHSGIDHYDAAYWLAHADGTTVDWTQPAAWKELASPSVVLPNLSPGDTICLSVRARDHVGNASAWTVPACTSRPFDDRALRASSGWRRANGSSYWLGTVTKTTSSAKSLKRAGVSTESVGIIGDTCASCGTVELKVGSTTIGEIDLKTATTKHKQVRLLPGFPTATGTVTLTTVSSGKDVRIDGLVVIRTAASPPSLP